MLGNWPLRGYKASNWEGGIREPAMVRWPGRVAANATTWEIGTTYDIFPTVLSLAGGELPKDRAIDGRDLSGVLLAGAKSPHQCVFHWHDSTMTDDGSGLSAVRCGDHKAHFYTQPDFGKEANRTSWPIGKQDPPLLFNISADPSETDQIDATTEEYKAHLAIISAARDAHLATIVPVCSQDKAPCGGDNLTYAVCGDPDSQKKYPQWPKCTTTPSTWEVQPCV